MRVRADRAERRDSDAAKRAKKTSPSSIETQRTMLDENSRLPRWTQIVNILRARIAANGSEVTGLSDQALAREFGVSALTVRQAVQDLVRSGLVTRHRGKGTFVVAKPVSGAVANLHAFMSDWRVEGQDVRVEILEHTRSAASIPIAAALGLKPGYLVAYLRRLRRADGYPVGLDYRYYLAEIDERLDDADLAHETIWEVIETKLGMTNLHANTTIRASAANDEEAELLDIRRGSPVLNRGFHLLTSTGRPLLVGHSIYHPDRFIHARSTRRTDGVP